MDTFAEVVILIGTAVVGLALARRFGLAAPILLVVIGLALSFLPGFPAVRLDPDLVIVGILPPLLYVAALQTSVPAFRFNLRPILLLGIGLVIVTTFTVGFVLHALLPAVPLAACVALGAVVAPPDAVAATAVARRIGLPRRIVTILEGESLINDAGALVLLRVSIAAMAGVAVTPTEIGIEIARDAGGGLLLGAIAAVLMGHLHRRITDALLDNALSLLTPLTVALVAELLNTSGIVAVVVAGLALGHRMPTLLSAASRLQVHAFWRLVTFLLEGLVFLLVGLQLREILTEINTAPATTAVVTVAVLATVIGSRFIWLYPATYLVRLLPRVRRRDPAPPLRVPTLIAWAGMRGVVTLAAVLALPHTLAGGEPYPRGLFVWLAFMVILVTVVLQGATLPAVARRLAVDPDDPVQDALTEAEVQNQAGRRAREALDANADGAPPAVVERLHGLVDERSNSAWERVGGGQETPSEAYRRLRMSMIDVEREVFRVARDEGRIPEEVLSRTYRDLDLEESLLNERTS